MEPSLILGEPAVHLRGKLVGKVANIPTSLIPLRRPYYYLFLIRFLSFIILSLSLMHPASAQMCGLCKLSLLNSPEGRALSKAFNHGILFLLAMPYMVGGLITFGLYSINRKQVDEKE